MPRLAVTRLDNDVPDKEGGRKKRERERGRDRERCKRDRVAKRP